MTDPNMNTQGYTIFCLAPALCNTFEAIYWYYVITRLGQLHDARKANMKQIIWMHVPRSPMDDPLVSPRGLWPRSLVENV